MIISNKQIQQLIRMVNLFHATLLQLQANNTLSEKSIVIGKEIEVLLEQIQNQQPEELRDIE